MTMAEIKRLGDYVRLTCERYQVWDDNTKAAEAELPILHRTIERLMRIASKTEDKAVRVILARIEQDARLCRDSILERLGNGN